MKLFTIGHSNHTIDQFVQLLKKYGIEQVVDVPARLTAGTSKTTIVITWKAI